MNCHYVDAIYAEKYIVYYDFLKIQLEILLYCVYPKLNVVLYFQMCLCVAITHAETMRYVLTRSLKTALTVNAWTDIKATRTPSIAAQVCIAMRYSMHDRIIVRLGPWLITAACLKSRQVICNSRASLFFIYSQFRVRFSKLRRMRVYKTLRFTTQGNSVPASGAATPNCDRKCIVLWFIPGFF